MKKNLTIFIVFAFAVFAYTSGQGQVPLKYCGTQEIHNEYVKNHPEVLELERLQDEYTKEYIKTMEQLRTPPPVYIIPVVFHILHEYGEENISKAQILDQMAILNRDYRRLNSDTNIVVPSFKSIVADCEIEFRLATIDPNGNCTDGIERIVTPETNIGDNGSKIHQWPREKYLNVWVVKDISSGAAGYSQYPSAVLNSNSVNDGVMILNSYIGSIGTGSVGTSRALTHEIGHFLNLPHTWGSTNSPGVACGDDGVTDTPVTKGWTQCNLTGSICNPPIIENVQNYMEYAYCARMFTNGQAARMRSALTNAIQYPFRANLWSATNLAATGALANPAPACTPVADFDPSKIFICMGTSVTFTDLSWNTDIVTWDWTFPGGTPSTSNLQNPVIQYNAPGVNDVILVVGNGNGSYHSIVRPGHVTVSSPVGSGSVPFSESFETLTIPGNDWFIDDQKGGNTWAITSAAAKTGSKSIQKINFAGNPIGNDAFLTQAIDLTYVSGTNLTFQLAFALKSSPTVINDQLKVLSSTDCGKIWTTRYTKKGGPLSTAGIISNTGFVPTASQWQLQTVGLSTGQVSGKASARFKFEYTFDVGNNIYIDDINITGTVGVNEAQTEQLQLAVVPNPSTSAPVVSFELQRSETVSVVVTDLLGRMVDQVRSQKLEAGEHQFQLDADMKPGIYFVQLYLGQYPVTKKIVIE